LSLLTGIAAQAASALRNASLFDQVEAASQRQGQLSRYMSPDVAKGIVDGTISADLDGKRTEATVLVAAVQGFDDMAEALEPADLVSCLNRYFRITTDIVARHQGTLGRFDGDGVKAFWNVMFPDEEPARHALMTALQMQASAWYFNLQLQAQGQPCIAVAITLNTGAITAGNIGGERVEYAVLGAPAERIRQIQYRVSSRQVLAFEATHGPVRDACAAVRLPPLPLEDPDEDAQLVSIRGLQTGEDKMMHSIPVRVLDAKENLLGEGMITGSAGAGEALQIFFSTEAVLVADQRVRLLLDLPEIAEPLELAGAIQDETRETYYGQAAFSKSTLGKVEAADAVLGFLRPGALLESDRDWDAMKRT
jgi:class 3 adenylate cyclase